MRQQNFESLLETADLRLFEKITSQTTEGDKRSLLACQSATRRMLGDFTYLEIGSYLGGSLQPFLLDSRCRKIYSIDKRPASQPDERGIDYVYKNNSTNRMLENLKQVSSDLEKIVCLDGDASEIEPERIEPRPDLCFIDGEHTDEAAQSDFHFCLNVLKENGAILFHDAAVIYNGLQEIVNYLRENNRKFNAYILPEVMFVIEIGDFPLHRDPKIAEMLVNNHTAYLFGLRYNDYYRDFVNKPLFKKYRNFRAWLAGSNVSE